MIASASRPSIIRYLRVTGSVNTWFLFVFLAFVIWCSYVRFQGHRFTSFYLFLMLVPLATGTGVLTAARAGRLDLLFGAGETRTRLWCTLIGYAWGIPTLMAGLICCLSAPLESIRTFVPLLALMIFTGGVSFTIGLIETRYITGVVWLLLRMMVIMWPDATRTLGQLQARPASEISWRSMALVAAFPESLMSGHMPTFALVGVASAGAAAMIASFLLLRSADFGGKPA